VVAATVVPGRSSSRATSADPRSFGPRSSQAASGDVQLADQRLDDADAGPPGQGWDGPSHEFDAAEPDEPRGRHSVAPDRAQVQEPGGRHSGTSAPRSSGARAADTRPPAARSSGSRSGSRSGGSRSGGRRLATTYASDVALADLDLPEDASPEQVDAVAEKMLDRLAVATPRPRFLDPDDLPGGKWGFAAGATLLVLLVMLVLWTVLGSVFGG
jgi:hypothetical protein